LASARAVQRFRSVFGHPPDVAGFAPGRLNLVGEHTDYNDGFVLPFALRQGVTALVARRSDELLRLRSAQFVDEPVDLSLDALSPGAVTGWAAYAAGTVWSLRQSGHHIAGVDVLVDGDVPPGAGLASSAALECSVVAALAEAHEVALRPVDVAAVARRAENGFVGMPCGVMDQLAAVLARAGHALFLDTRTLESTHVPLDLEAAGVHVVVIDTRVSHRLVDDAYAERRRTCERAAATLGVRALRDVPADGLDDVLLLLGDDEARRRVRHVVAENARVLEAVRLLRAGELRALGPLLSASHASLRDDYAVSCAELDVAVDAAVAAGALGARMTGAGFGGCALALVAVENAGAVRAAVERAFAVRRFAAPRIFAVEPAAGARRVDTAAPR